MRAIRSSAALLLAALLITLAGCGGGGGSKTTASVPAATPGAAEFSTGTATITIPPSTAPARKPKKKTTPTPTSTSPEQQPGGAGDETPIATQALFTAKGGKISPSRVRVPPFIAVNIVLRAVDKKPYTLLVNGKEVAVGEGRTEGSLKLDGLRPGAKYVVHPRFGVRPRQIVIVANAEPGP